MVIKLKKVILSSVIASLLAGCGGSSDDTNPSISTVTLKLDAPHIIQNLIETNGDLRGLVKDKNGYEHEQDLDGYTIVVNDAIDGKGSNYTIEDIDLSLEENASFDLPIEGSASVYVVQNETYQSSLPSSADSYGFESVETINDNTRYELYIDSNLSDTFTITLGNTQYDYVTLLNSDIIVDAMPPTIGGIEMTFVAGENIESSSAENGYYFGYITADTQIEVVTNEGTAIGIVTVSEDRNNHTQLIISHDPSGSIQIGQPNFGEPGEPIIIDPTPNDPVDPPTLKELKDLISAYDETGDPEIKTLIENFDTSGIELMDGLFLGSYFDGDLSNWDTSNVTTMSNMFYASNFSGKKTNLSNWDTSKVVYMNDMFRQSGFSSNQKITWDTSKVVSMDSMFFSTDFSGDVSSWDVSSVTNMYQMFASTPNFNSDLSNWNVSNVTNIGYIFFDSSFNGDLSSWNVANVTDMTHAFSESSFTGDISGWNTASVLNMRRMFSRTAFNGDISGWDTSQVFDMSEMFYMAQNFSQDLSDWDVSNVNNYENFALSSGFESNPELHPNFQ